MRRIHIVNQSTVVKNRELIPALAGIQYALTNDLAPTWLTEAKVDGTRVATPGQETIFFLDNSDQADALGYHTLLPGKNVPVGFVFAKTSLDHGVDWREPLSHEIFEQTVNPFLLACALSLRGKERVAWILEVCDQCERDTYKSKGEVVSDFVTPAWFQSEPPAGEPLDQMRLLKTPGTLRPGGYISYSTDLASWQQVYLALDPPRTFREVLHRSRYSRSMRIQQTLETLFSVKAEDLAT
jgi:hypothetical protein